MLLIVASAYIAAIAVAIAWCSDKNLGNFISCVIVAQQFVQVGRQGAKGANDGAAEIFNSLNMINFEVEFLKPGCAIGAFSFITVYWGTLVVCVIAWMIFMFAAWLRF